MICPEKCDHNLISNPLLVGCSHIPVTTQASTRYQIMHGPLRKCFALSIFNGESLSLLSHCKGKLIDEERNTNTVISAKYMNFQDASRVFPMPEHSVGYFLCFAPRKSSTLKNRLNNLVYSQPRRYWTSIVDGGVSPSEPVPVVWGL